MKDDLRFGDYIWFIAVGWFLLAGWGTMVGPALGRWLGAW